MAQKPTTEFRDDMKGPNRAFEFEQRRNTGVTSRSEVTDPQVTSAPMGEPLAQGVTKPWKGTNTKEEEVFQLPDSNGDKGKPSYAGWVPPSDPGGARPPLSEPTVEKEKEKEKTEIDDGLAESTQTTVGRMLEDPTQYIKDQNIEQRYLPQEVTPDTIVEDPNKHALGQLAGTAAETIDTPVPLETSEVEATTGETTDPVQVADFEAALINPQDLTKALDEISKVEPMKAASMAEKLDGLLEGMEQGNVPLWARPAVTKVEQMLAARGISASSVGRDSLFNAIIQSAMPIAQQDATLEQDANKTRYNSKIQAVLSDVNMEFAAKQFNATSVNQTNQFRTQLQAQVDMQNASRQDAMSQFNANLSTQVDLQNASRQDAMAQFNTQTEVAAAQFNASQVNAMTQMTTQLQSQRDQFNAQMASQIEQSNVNWRRQVNTANTAGKNAVNQANAQNAFNLSNQALTFLWQEKRDEAHWDFQATEAEKDRRNQLEATLLASETAMGGEIGKTIENILNGTNFVSKFLDSWGD